jgi:DNA-binding transcriptional MerR regulator
VTANAPSGATVTALTSPSAGAMTDQSSPLMSIGDVLALLREEFPDVTISKLRFLEAEGLVEPARTSAGYRKYSRADVTRLHFVLAAQRDNYLPLRVIREHLAAMDRGEAPPEIGRASLAVVGDEEPIDRDDWATGTATAGQAAPSPLDRAALLDRSGLTDETLAALEAAGLIAAGASGWYDSDALAIAEVAAAFAEYGLGPRHLRAYRAAADREVGMIAAIIAPLARASTPAARVRAKEAILELTALSERLHAALVRVGLRETLGQ